MTKLPTPDSTANEISNQLTSLIRQEIEFAGGHISFARFMEKSLYEPGLGYYSAGSHKLGRHGDFVTAPEISPLFAQCIAKQCLQAFPALHEHHILEIGAGSGILAHDLLCELEKKGNLPTHYFILEISADLRERQKQLLEKKSPHFLSRITWLDRLPVEKFSGIILANEVMDALPVHCFRIENQSIRERCVTWENNKFTWKIAEPTSQEFTQSVSTLQQECELHSGYESEINLMLPGWINSLAHILQQGMILLFDYGYGRREYYHPERDRGTLTCFYQHHHHSDPFTHVGLQDMTAHVDFTQVIDSASSAGLSLGGYTTQSSFLFACGLLDIASAEDLPEVAQFQQNQAIKTLTLPSEMGETIKVMGLTKDLDLPLIGFSLHERSRDL